MDFKAVLFDLDGTLVNTLDDLADSVNQALDRMSLPRHPVDSFRLKVGDGARTMIARSLPADRQDLLDTVLQMQQAYYAEHLIDKSRPYPGIERMLGDLRARGLRLAVLSNKPDHLTRLVVERLFHRSAFDQVVGHRDGTALKPDPAAALAVAERFGLPAGQVAYVGDTAVDMRTATAAGMFAVGVTWGFRDRDELRRNGSSVIIDHPNQLIDALVAACPEPEQ